MIEPSKKTSDPQGSSPALQTPASLVGVSRGPSLDAPAFLTPSPNPDSSPQKSSQESLLQYRIFEAQTHRVMASIATFAHACAWGVASFFAGQKFIQMVKALPFAKDLKSEAIGALAMGGASGACAALGGLVLFILYKYNKDFKKDNPSLFKTTD